MTDSPFIFQKRVFLKELLYYESLKNKFHRRRWILLFRHLLGHWTIEVKLIVFVTEKKKLQDNGRKFHFISFIITTHPKMLQMWNNKEGWYVLNRSPYLISPQQHTPYPRSVTYMFFWHLSRLCRRSFTYITPYWNASPLMNLPNTIISHPDRPDVPFHNFQTS